MHLNICICIKKPNRRFDDFLRHYLGEQPGDVIWLESGLVVGQHRGLWFHTIGQRKGIVYVCTPMSI